MRECEFESGVTTFEIAQSISNSLAKKALAGKFQRQTHRYQLSAITEDGSIEIVTPDHEDALDILRHFLPLTCFAQATRRLFPEIHLGLVLLFRMVSLLIRTIQLVKSLTKIYLVSKRRNEEDCQGKLPVNPAKK